MRENGPRELIDRVSSEAIRPEEPDEGGAVSVGVADRRSERRIRSKREDDFAFLDFDLETRGLIDESRLIDKPDFLGAVDALLCRCGVAVDPRADCASIKEAEAVATASEARRKVR